MDNPYAPPKIPADPRVPRFNWLRVFFFIVNFSAGTLFALMCIVSIVAPESPGQFLGGIFFLIPSAVYAVSEWLAFYRQRTTVERKLAYVNFGVAAFAIFGLVSNIGEAWAEGDPLDVQFISWFTLIGLSITAHSAAAGWFRWRWTRQR